MNLIPPETPSVESTVLTTVKVGVQALIADNPEVVPDENVSEHEYYDFDRGHIRRVLLGRLIAGQRYTYVSAHTFRPATPWDHLKLAYLPERWTQPNTPGRVPWYLRWARVEWERIPVRLDFQLICPHLPLGFLRGSPTWAEPRVTRLHVDWLCGEEPRAEDFPPVIRYLHDTVGAALGLTPVDLDLLLRAAGAPTDGPPTGTPQCARLEIRDGGTLRLLFFEGEHEKTLCAFCARMRIVYAFAQHLRAVTDS